MFITGPLRSTSSLAQLLVCSVFQSANGASALYTKSSLPALRVGLERWQMLILWIRIFFTLVLSVAGGIAYRMGGSGNYPRYFRELGQGLCVVALMLALGLGHWSLVLCFGVCWAESTYFKKEDTDGKWINFFLVGCVFGLVALPYCAFTNSYWVGFGIRFVVCAILTPVWNFTLSPIVSKMLGIGRDVSDEFGRGFICVATLPLLLIGE